MMTTVDEIKEAAKGKGRVLAVTPDQFWDHIEQTFYKKPELSFSETLLTLGTRSLTWNGVVWRAVSLDTHIRARGTEPIKGEVVLLLVTNAGRVYGIARKATMRADRGTREHIHRKFRSMRREFERLDAQG
jgi:hypothetical protein